MSASPETAEIGAILNNVVKMGAEHMAMLRGAIKKTRDAEKADSGLAAGGGPGGDSARWVKTA